MNNATTTYRIRGLDGIRALSVLAVLAHHTGILPVHGGFIGVDVFFVLSGFLITRLLRDEFDATGTIDFQNFYIRRAKRLLPALGIFLAFVMGYCLIFQPPVNLWWEIGPAALYFMNWTRAYNLYDANFTAHTWTLSIEEQFYMIWPVALLIILRLRGNARAVATAALAVAAILWRLFLMHQGASGARIYTGFDTHAEGLLFGAMLAVMPADLAKKIGTIFWVPSAIYLAVCVFSADVAKFASGGYGYAVTSFAAFAVIAKTVNGQQTLGVGLLSFAPLAWLGKLSYGIYLWHYAIIKILLYGGHDPIMLFFGTSAYPVATMVAACLIGSIIPAAISWYFVESPILKTRRFPGTQSTAQLRLP